MWGRMSAKVFQVVGGSLGPGPVFLVAVAASRSKGSSPVTCEAFSCGHSGPRDMLLPPLHPAGWGNTDTIRQGSERLFQSGRMQHALCFPGV